MNWTVSLAHEAEKQLKAIPPDRRERSLHDIRELKPVGRYAYAYRTAMR
jgi:mRNA-degrading endonuclease RelE of RelBE toxin-antitoxin system